MWNRAELKERAKQVLKTTYWKASFISIIIAMVSGGVGRCSFQLPGDVFNHNEKQKIMDNITTFVPHAGNNLCMASVRHARIASAPDIGEGMLIAYLMLLVILMVAVIWACILAFKIFVGYPLEVGGRRFFIRTAQDQNDAKIDHVGFSFKHGQYMSVIKAMIWKDIFIFLWSLLFVIPGIVKSYAYMMVPYIIADNPTMNYRQAIKMSMKMTYGHKWNIFILQLSFIGWYILGLLCLVIGTIFVMPYQNATLAELYLVLRKNMIEAGYYEPEDFGLTSHNNIEDSYMGYQG